MERSDMLKMHGIIESQRQVDQGEAKQSMETVIGKHMYPQMTHDALELQYQGLRLIATLCKFDSNYCKGENHSDVNCIQRKSFDASTNAYMEYYLTAAENFL